MGYTGAIRADRPFGMRMKRAWRESPDRLLFDSNFRSTVPLWAGRRRHARRHDAQQTEENDDHAAASETRLVSKGQQVTPGLAQGRTGIDV